MSDRGSDSQLEQVIARIWAEALGVEEVHADANFFDLGGHSLAAIQIAIGLQEALHVELPMATLLDEPSFDTFVSAVRSLMRASTEAAERIV